MAPPMALALVRPVPLVWPSVLVLAKTTAKTSWIQVAKTGTFFSARYGKFSITEDDLRQMLHNFTHVTPTPPTQIPVDYDHLSMEPKSPGDGKAAGWIRALDLRENDSELWAEVAWTPEAAEAIKAGEYRFVSPSFVRDYVWKEGKNIGATLIAAAITNHPFLEGMAAVTLSGGLGDVAVAVGDQMTFAAMWYEDRRMRVQAKLREVHGIDGDGLGTWHSLWVRDMDETAVVYEFDGKSYRRSYLIDDLGVVTMGDAEEVHVPAPSEWQALRKETAMSGNVFKLRDAHGAEVEVKAEGLAQFMADQIAAAKTEGQADGKKGAVPDGSVVVSASKLQEFEANTGKVTELSTKIDQLTTENAEAKRQNHLMQLRGRLDKLSQAGRITKPQRDWAEKTFGEPTQLAACEEWEKTIPTTPVVALNREHGSSADAPGAPTDPAAEILALAHARVKDKGISLRDAVNQISEERQDLAGSYRETIREAGEPRVVVPH